MITLSNLADSHTHTWYSSDSDDSLDTMCKAAAQNGLKHYTITDHCEIGPDFTIEMFGYFKRYEKDIRATADRFAPLGLEVLLGIELGEATHNLALADKVLELADFDFVIGSLHNLRGYKDFYYLTFQKDNVHFYLDRYFEELLALAEWDKFDVLGHLTYPVRYMHKAGIVEYDLTPYRAVIDKILTTVIRNGKGIEINTSGLRQSIGQTMPGVDLIRRYYDLGGRILTLGSDAHKYQDVGAGLMEGAEIARCIGFEYLTYYKKRQAHQIKLS